MSSTDKQQRDVSDLVNNKVLTIAARIMGIITLPVIVFIYGVLVSKPLQELDGRINKLETSVALLHDASNEYKLIISQTTASVNTLNTSLIDLNSQVREASQTLAIIKDRENNKGKSP